MRLLKRALVKKPLSFSLPILLGAIPSYLCFQIFLPLPFPEGRNRGISFDFLARESRSWKHSERNRSRTTCDAFFRQCFASCHCRTLIPTRRTRTRRRRRRTRRGTRREEREGTTRRRKETKRTKSEQIWSNGMEVGSTTGFGKNANYKIIFHAEFSCGVHF